MLSPVGGCADTLHNVITLADARRAAPSIAAPRSEAFAQCIVTALLYAIPALICVYGACVTDPDVWWHLRSGEWILANHAVPHIDPFAPGGISRPWAAYSWLYEVLVAGLFGRFGMAGIVIYTTGMVLLITAALHRLIRRPCADFNLGVLLTFLACLAIGRLYTPRPWLFTILFFVLELGILFHVRRTGQVRGLLWLPAIFAVWANVHIQFVDGLLVLAFATAEGAAGRWWAAARTRLTQRNQRGALALTATLVASVLATLANPYGFGIYKVAHDLAAQPEVIDLINELKPIPFRSLPDYCVLLLAIVAVAMLARSRDLRPFETALLGMAFLLSFRSLRDVWVMAAAATAIIAQELGTRPGDPLAAPQPEPRSLGFIAGALVVPLTALALFAGCAILHVDDGALRAKLSRELPAAAAEAIVRGGYPGPVFNTYNWGGYLMWSLRQPVAVDGRAALQGTERLDRILATWNGEPGWTSDPELCRAGIVIGPVKSPLVQLLRVDPRFTLAYQDQIAAVFVPGRR